MYDKKICALYTNRENTSMFDVGIIIGEDKEGIVIISISESGIYENLQYIQKKSIYLTEYDNAYCINIRKKIDIDEIKKYCIILKKNENLKIQIIEFSIKNNIFVSIELLQSNSIDVYGKIDKIENEKIYVHMFGENDAPDGIAVVEIDSISRICIN